LSDPMRVVVDISGGNLSDFQEPMSVEDGVVSQIAFQQFNANGFYIARVMVGFENEMAYDVKAEGKSVVIRSGAAIQNAFTMSQPPPAAPADPRLEKRIKSARREAELASKKARFEKAEAQKAARTADLKSEEARVIKIQAEKIAKEANAAKAEALHLRAEAKKAAKRDRAEAQRLAQEAEARLAEVNIEAQKLASRRAEAERVAARHENSRREAEESAARAKAEHKTQLALIQKEIAKAEKSKASAAAAEKRAALAQVEANEAIAEAQSASRKARDARAEMTRRLATIDAQEKETKKAVATLKAERSRLSQEKDQIATERAALASAHRKLSKREEAIKAQQAKSSHTSQVAIEKERKALQAERTRIQKMSAQLKADKRSITQAQKDVGAQKREVETRVANLRNQESFLQKAEHKVAAEKRQVAQKRKQTGSTLDQQASALKDQQNKVEKEEAALIKARRKFEAEKREIAAMQKKLRLKEEAIAKKAEREESKLARREAEIAAKAKKEAARQARQEAEFAAKAKKEAAKQARIREQKKAERLTLSGIRTVGSYGNKGIQLKLNGESEVEVQKIENPPRLVVDIVGAKKGLRKTSYNVDHPAVSKVRLGTHKNMLRVVFDLNNSSLDHNLDISPEGIRVSFKEATPKAAAAPVFASSSVKDIQFSGRGGSAEIAIQIPDGVKAYVDSRSSRAWVLKLEGANVAKELERSLDTKAFGTVVRMVSTYQASTTPEIVNIVANLSGKATSKITRKGNKLIWKITEKAEKKQRVATSTLPQTAGFESNKSSTRYKSKRRRRITIDLKDADIVNVLRLIADVSGQNLITSESVKGTITMRLKNVPWDDALDTILKTKGLAKVRQHNIVRIAPAAEIQKEQEMALARKKASEEVEETMIKLVTVNYASAKDIVPQLRPILSRRGSVQTDERTNTIILEDVGSNIDRVIELTKRLDKQTPQVLIEARIVEAASSNLTDLGIQWGGSGQASATSGNPTGLPFPNSISVAGGGDDTQTINEGTSDPSRFAVNLPAAVGSGAGGALGFIFGSAGGNQLLSLRLSALEERGKGKIISSPRITTLDNRTAKISQGIDIPITVTSAAGANTRFVSAALELEVTPHVTNDGSVLLDINVSKNEPNFQKKGAAGDPTIEKKTAKTAVLVKDNDTTVIGGIYTRNKSENVAGVPFLSDLPLIGWLFKKRSVLDSRNELLIFITPRIVNRQESIMQASSLSGNVEE
ncbi:type IV pilus secretin PilQ, partial [Myxococcota bacterium]|nr:type IV pilus secretin PilQ [Myxococcota bacterium]